MTQSSNDETQQLVESAFEAAQGHAPGGAPSNPTPAAPAPAPTPSPVIEGPLLDPAIRLTVAPPRTFRKRRSATPGTLLAGFAVTGLAAVVAIVSVPSKPLPELPTTPLLAAVEAPVEVEPPAATLAGDAPVLHAVEVTATRPRYDYLPGAVRDPHLEATDDPEPVVESPAAPAPEPKPAVATMAEVDDVFAPSASALTGSRDSDAAAAALAASIRVADGGDAERALSLGMGAWRLDPADARIANHMAALSLQTGRWPVAEAWARWALGEDVGLSRAWGNLGAALVAQGRTRDARDAYREAVALTPNDWRAMSGLARASSLLGEHDAAITTYRNALAVAPGEAVVRYNLALAFDRAGRTDDAREAFVEYLGRAEGLDPERDSRVREWLNRHR